jgi:hypothetical protein
MGRVAIVVLGLLAFVVCGRTASIRPLWYDERFTQFLARSNSVGELNAALASGADLNPPLSYLFTKASVAILGETNFAIRLPALIGGVVAMVSLHAFVRRRAGSTVATVAATALILPEGVTHYFTEARPYGPMLGFAGLALLLWQRIPAIGMGRLWPGMLFAAAMSLGMATHYYFAVVVAALGLAEVARIATERKLNGVTAAAFLSPVLSLALMRPLWGGPQKAYTDGFWARVNPSPLEIANVYFSYSDAVTLAVAILSLLLATLAAKSVSPVAPDEWPFAERAALVAFAAIPFLAFGFSVAITKVYVPRYCLPFAIGMAGCAAISLGAMAKRPVVLWCIAATFALGGLGVQYRWAADRGRDRAERLSQAIAQLNEVLGDQPLVVEMAGPDRIDFAIHGGRSTYRPILLLDVEEARRRDGQDTVDRGSLALAAMAGLATATFDDVVEEIRSGRCQFYLGSFRHWRAKRLEGQGVTFEVVREIETNRLGGIGFRQQPPATLYRMRLEKP